MNYLSILTVLAGLLTVWEYFLDVGWKNPLLFPVAGLHEEIYCNTLKLQDLGFTKWAIAVSYIASLLIMLSILAVIVIVIWIRAKSNQSPPPPIGQNPCQKVDCGVQTYMDMENECEIAVMGVALDALQPTQIEAESKYSDYSNNSMNSNSSGSDSGVLESGPDELKGFSLGFDDHDMTKNGSGDLVMYSTTIQLCLDPTRNQKNKVRCFSSFLERCVGHETFTTHFYIYVQNELDILI